MIRRLVIPLLLAVLALPVGILGAQWTWQRYHQRDDMPGTGLYYGLLRGSFDCTNIDDPFNTLGFRSQTPCRWYWRQPTNFLYTKIEVTWSEWMGNSSANHQATVSLPDFSYESDNAGGPFTRAVLANWLYGTTTNFQASNSVDVIFGYFEAAARGTLPPPRHHTYYFEDPIQAHFVHFLLGFGVGWTVYVWLLVWLVLVSAILRMAIRKTHPN